MTALIEIDLPDLPAEDVAMRRVMQEAVEQFVEALAVYTNDTGCVVGALQIHAMEMHAAFAHPGCAVSTLRAASDLLALSCREIVAGRRRTRYGPLCVRMRGAPSQ